MIAIEPRHPEREDQLAAVAVQTVDATGEKREYEISLRDEYLGDGEEWGAIMTGKRADEHEYDRDTPDAPTRAAYAEAAAWFQSEGFDVYGWGGE